MEKYTTVNWTKYVAGTLAITGMMLFGACGSERNTADDQVYAPETEMVNREVETQEYAEDNIMETETTAEDQNMNSAATSNSATSNWNRGSMYASSVNISRLLDQHPNVNQAIRKSLATMPYEQSSSYGVTMEDNMVD